MAEPKLATRGLTRVAGSDILLDEVDLEVARGEVVAVAGPSGAGKSSLLRLLVRLDEPTRGVVLLDGDDVRRLDPRDLRRRVGLVTQAPALVPGTVTENVTLGPRLRGETPNQGRALALLRRVGLDGFANRDVRDLSGGEAQRVSLARTLLNDPEVLLLDEPTASLDPATTAAVEALLSELLESLGLTAVLVTHDPRQAERLADRVVRLEAGRLVEADPPAEVST